jgi:DNA-binding protein H-NS
MPRVNLSGMNVEGLMNLRRQVDERLLEHRAEIQKLLERMGGAIAHITGPRGRASSLRGRKVPPKYRSPSGETWAGRGARPTWLVEALKRGKKIEHFLIDKSARKVERRRRAKR